MLGALWGLIIYLVVSALVIWIVGRMNLGMTVSGFGSALVAAAVIAIVTAVILWLLDLLGLRIGGGILGAIVALIVSAIVLMISDRFVSGMKVNGFTGALIAAIAIAVVGWLVSWVLSLFGIGVAQPAVVSILLGIKLV